MASCPRLSSCPLFAQFAKKSTLKVWQTYYCEGEHERCERWRLLVAGREAPPGLLPNGRTLAGPLEQLEAYHLI